MSDNNYHKLGVAPRFHEIFSTGLYTGLLPGAPGTYAAFVALLIWYALYLWLSPVALTVVTLALTAVVTVAGAWTSGVMERYWGPDPRAVVIDEYVGTWIACLVAPCAAPHEHYTWLMAFAGFALFRVIDITKPLGCRKVERIVPGGWGVMLDDVLAGFYAMLILWGIKWCFGL